MLPLVKNIIGRDRYDSWYYGLYYRRLLQRDGCALGPAEGETAYLNRWRHLTPHIDPYTYRYYARFCGPTADIVPDYILHNQIEPCINPLELWDDYEDKNRFATYLGADCLPATVLCRMGGGTICDASHQPLEADVEAILSACRYPSLILKPALGTSCGERIVKFDRVDVSYRDREGRILDGAYLLNYGSDWVLQQCVVQHPFLRQFCTTAVCTLRLAVYRSVNDGQSTVTGAVMRVGREGSVVDNTSSGGCYVGVDLVDGTLHRTFYDVRGKGHHEWNHIDLTQQRFVVPNWQKVLSMARRVADAIPDHHLIALDITLNEDGTPMVLEYNIGYFSAYLFNQVGQPPLGGYVDEVIAYCLQKR